jgi:hypothetical protein
VAQVGLSVILNPFTSTTLIWETIICGGKQMTIQLACKSYDKPHQNMVSEISVTEYIVSDKKTFRPLRLGSNGKNLSAQILLSFGRLLVSVLKLTQKKIMSRFPKILPINWLEIILIFF